jgi:hypothetical protein
MQREAVVVEVATLGAVREAVGAVESPRGGHQDALMVRGLAHRWRD